MKMVSIFGTNKKKKETKEKKEAATDKKKIDKEQKDFTSAATDQPPSQPLAQQGDTDHQPEEAIVSEQNKREEEEESSIAFVLNNDAGTTSASGQAATSISSDSPAREKKEGISRYSSSFEGGVEGRCRTCELVKVACNCQHCHCCGRFLVTLSSRKHCRRCWRATCPKCSCYERINAFLQGEMSRTCRECAVPHSLVYLNELAYSFYETLAAGEEGKRLAKPEQNDATPAAAARTATQLPDAHSFHWGLYALGCAMQAPRRCINPGCPAPVSYDHTCEKCKLPTVTLAFHRLRHVEVADRTDTTASSDSKAAAVTAETVEETVKTEYDAMAAARTAAEEDSLFDAALPHDMESYLFASLQGNGWSSRKVLLSLVACAAAAESSALPNISLAMMDVPIYARLLRPLQVSDTFSVFNAPGHVRFIAFNSGANNRSSIHQVLGLRTSPREAWTNQAMTEAQSVAKVVSSAAEAKNKGLTDCVAKMNVREGVLAYIAENDVMARLSEMVGRMAKEGLDVVLCGHGIGGAVATWVSTTLLLENTADLKDRLMCVTFGAPLVASFTLTDLLTQHGLHRCFQHFVNASDMVPRISYIDALLESGNTSGTASIVGRGESTASVGDVREAVEMWVGKYEEPHGAAAPQLRAGKDSFSLAGFVRKMRNTNEMDAKDKKLKGSDVEKLVSVTEDSAGDIFRTSREPFDNNVIRAVDEATAPKLHDVDFERFATAQHRAQQKMDPCGCFHFLWHARGKYMCTDDPATSIGLLSDRTDLRVKLRDHLLSAYNKAMMEYVYSVPLQH